MTATDVQHCEDSHCELPRGHAGVHSMGLRVRREVAAVLGFVRDYPDPAPLPRIVRFLETDDSPDSSCPHCGATGRFILRFVVEDGRTLAAMRGCAKLFPVSRIATEELRLSQKKAKFAKSGWKLNRRDTEALDAIAKFYAGELDERRALELVDLAKRANQSRFR